MAKKPTTKSDKVAPLAGSYDLVLKGGRVIDPAQGLDGSYDIGIRKGRIAAGWASVKGTAVVSPARPRPASRGSGSRAPPSACRDGR